MLAPLRPKAHVWVRDRRPTLTIITDAEEGISLNWPEDSGALLVFDAGYDVTVTVVDA